MVKVTRLGSLTAYVRKAWVLKSDRRLSAGFPGWTAEPTVHAVVVQHVKVAEHARRRGACRAFLDRLKADDRFAMVIVEAVQNEHLAAALLRWGWDHDLRVMDFYWPPDPAWKPTGVGPPDVRKAVLHPPREMPGGG